MTSVPDQEWRVEVNLDDEDHGYSLGERLRAHDLDDHARERLGGGVIVTREGPRLHVYTKSLAAAREAERVVRELIEADRLTADISVTVWDEERDAWLDAEGGEVVEDPRAGEEGPEYFVLVESDDQAALEALAGAAGRARRGAPRQAARRRRPTTRRWRRWPSACAARCRTPRGADPRRHLLRHAEPRVPAASRRRLPGM